MDKYKILLDNPYAFFKHKKENLKETASYLLFFVFLFTALNELSIRFGITKYVPKVGILESTVINSLSIIAGVMAIALILTVFVKSMKRALFLTAYSFTPLFVFAWIPFAAISMISIVWSLFFLGTGLHIKQKFSHKKSFSIVLLIVLAALALILISQNKIVPLIPTIS